MWPAALARLRRSPAAAAQAQATSPFDPVGEQRRLSEAMLRRAADLLLRPLDDRGQAQAQVQAFCDAMLGAAPELRLAWVWFGDPDTPLIEPQVVAGPAAAYAWGLRIERNWLTRIGPAFRALAGRAAESFRVSPGSLYPPWRTIAREHGVRSTLAVPLASDDGAQRGIFVVYAAVPDYFELVGVGLFEAVGQLLGAVLSQSVQHERLTRAAHTDALTGLHNRAYAAAAFAALQRAPRGGPPVCVMLLDLDHFKLVNDRHGHAGGDAVLIGVAQQLRSSLRRVDGLARWGGEEFLMWLPGADAPEALRVAAKLCEIVAAAPIALPDGASLSVTASIGVAQWEPGELVERAIARADEALYRAKQGGRNRVEATA